MISVIFLLAFLHSAGINSILTDFQNKGYYEIHEEQVGSRFYEAAYEQFDQLTLFIEKHPEWTQRLYQIDQQYLKMPENKTYGDPPIGYVDERKSGKSKKTHHHNDICAS